MMTKKTENEPDARLLEIMRAVYAEYTGYQVADVIRIIRQEIEAQREADALDAEISALLLRREYIGKVPARLQKPQTPIAEPDPQ